MWIIVTIVFVGVLIFLLKRRLNNYVLMARNITYIHEILHDEYEQYFPDEDTLLMTCGIIDTLSYAFSVEDMKLAVLSAKTGQFSVGVYRFSIGPGPSYRQQAFEACEILSAQDQFLNFVLQVEVMMFRQDTSHLPQDILDAVVSQRMNIMKAIDRAKQSYTNGNMPTAWYRVVSNFMTSEAFTEVRDELGIISPERENVTTHCTV